METRIYVLVRRPHLFLPIQFISPIPSIQHKHNHLSLGSFLLRKSVECEQGPVPPGQALVGAGRFSGAAVSSERTACVDVHISIECLLG